MTTPASEEYLEAIYHLRRGEEPVRPARLAEKLKISSAAVADMLARLERDGLIARTADRGVTFTAKGEALAVRQVSRHRLAERLLDDVLGLRWDRVHDEACKLEHVISPEAADGLERLLRRPKTCPHGNPIPNRDGVVVEPPTRLLSELAPGESGVIAKITEEDAAMLGQLLGFGLLPNVAVEVEGSAPFNGPLLIRVGRSRYALGREIARNIHVAATGTGAPPSSPEAADDLPPVPWDEDA
jgi:DtxR family Mn-dependent transcriptional regulator